jgi:hypothetical protein
MSVTITQQSLLPIRRDGQIATGGGTTSGGGSTLGGGGGGGGVTYVAGVNIIFSGTTISVVDAPSFAGNVTAPKFIEGSQCLALKYLPICNPIATGVLCVPIACISTCSIAPVACGTTSVLSPLVCGSTSVNTPVLNSSACMCGVSMILSCNANTPVFSSGFAGSGWKIDNTAGEITATFDNVYVRKNMTVYELDINKINSINGGLMVSAANGTVYCTSANKLYFDEDNGNKQFQFQCNDWVRAQNWTGRGIASYIGKVTGTTHCNTLGCAYASMSSTCTPWKNMELVQIGNSSCAARQNLIYITASDSCNPYIDMLSGVDTGSFTGKQKLRIGNLAGISDAAFGGALSGYGLYSNNVYLNGQIVIAGSSSGYANLTDKPTTLNAIESGTGTKLSGIAAGATVGATWGSNLYSVPAFLGGCSGAGLYMGATYMGYYNGSSWQSYIDCAGNSRFVGITEIGTNTQSYAGTVMNTAICGADIWENTRHDGYAGVLMINNKGYNGGTSEYRSTCIGNGKGSNLASFNANSSLTNIILGVSNDSTTTYAYVCSYPRIIGASTIDTVCTMTATNFILSSDETLKNNIQSLSIAPINIDYKQFNMKNEPEQLRFGVVAQDLQKTNPELVRTDENGILSVAYFDLLIREVAALKCQVKNLSLDLNYMRNYNC